MFKSILALIIILLSAGFALVYVTSMYDRVELNKEDLATINAAFEDVSTISSLITNTTRTLNEIPQATYEKLNTFLPETVDPIRLANTIKYIGAIGGFAITDIKIGERGNGASGGAGTPGATGASSIALRQLGADSESASGSAYQKTTASFSVITTYTGFQELLDNFEKSLGLFTITSVTFQPYTVTSTGASAPSNPSLALYQYAVELETYSLK